MAANQEFKILFDESGLSQRRFASLLGVNYVTVNRWFADREDTFEPPFYALQFLRMYVMLPEAARTRLPVKQAHKGDEEKV